MKDVRQKTRCMLVFGTRPEVIKLAPVALAMKAEPERFECILVFTGQHRDLGQQALAMFGLTPDVNLDLMSDNQKVSEFLGRALASLDPIVKDNHPDYVLVQGDTGSALAGALTAFNHKIPVAHIEAGLRTYDLMAPHPEEGNRQMISRITSLHFAPTETAKKRLVKEDVPLDKILVTGNTVVDAVHWISNRLEANEKKHIEEITKGAQTRFVLTTIHRRESFGEPLIGMLEAIRALAQDTSLGLTFLFPVHLNPEVATTVKRILGQEKNVRLLPALDYKTMLGLMPISWLVLTDSGGLQEEAPCFSVPVFVLRNLTERPEGIEAGVAKLIGTRKESILETVKQLAQNKAVYAHMRSGKNPYGDGHAAEAILERLSQEPRNRPYA